MDALVAPPAAYRVLLGNDWVRGAGRGDRAASTRSRPQAPGASVVIVDEPAWIRYYARGSVQSESRAALESPPGVRVRWMEPEGLQYAENIEQRRYHAIHVEPR
jgi:hypothetical protein